MARAPSQSGDEAPHSKGLAEAVKAEARRIGFDLAGIAPAVSPAGFADLRAWLARGFAGEMDYIPRREAAYEHPQSVLPTVKSVIVLAANYHARQTAKHQTGKHPGCGFEHPGCWSDARPIPPDSHFSDAGTASPSTQGAQSRTLGASPLGDSPAARVATYALGDADYHDVLRGMLRRLADFLHAQRPGCRTRGVVDTAPLLERDFARLAGLGWFGKNTMLIHKRAGSWLFLAALLTDAELEPDAPHETSHCGTCTRCLDACPTDAFPEPHVLDARRCISYLTIELRDRPIPVELREPMGDWLFGCDVCQDVCPWNRKAPATEHPAFRPRPDLDPADPVELLALTPDEFDRRFAHTPFARPGRPGILRNAAIVLGNTASPDDQRGVAALATALNDADPLIRGAAAWALGRLMSRRSQESTQGAALSTLSAGAVTTPAGAVAAGPEHCRRLLQSRRQIETDATVKDEVDAALGGQSC